MKIPANYNMIPADITICIPINFEIKYKVIILLQISLIDIDILLIQAL